MRRFHSAITCSLKNHSQAHRSSDMPGRSRGAASLNRRTSALTALLVCFVCLCGPASFAGLVVTFEESGSDVTATLSGSINALGTPHDTPTQPIDSAVRTKDSILYIGSGTNVSTAKNEFKYTGSTFPSTGGVTTNFNRANSSTANVPDQAFLIGHASFFLSPSYTLGTPFTGVITWQDKTLSELELIPGQYSATLFGSSSTVTVNVTSAVPEPSTWALAIGGLACGGWSLARRRRRAHGPCQPS